MNLETVMPFTPFHFGPGILIKSCAPRSFWLTSFIVPNVLIDLEVLYYLRRHQSPIHRYLHSYVGGIAAGVLGAILVFLTFLLLARFAATARSVAWMKATPKSVLLSQSLVAGLLGGVSHVLLDSVMHRDMNPWWPFSTGNGLLGVVSVSALHIALTVAGVFGLILLLMQRDS